METLQVFLAKEHLRCGLAPWPTRRLSRCSFRGKLQLFSFPGAASKASPSPFIHPFLFRWKVVCTEAEFRLSPPWLSVSAFWGQASTKHAFTLYPKSESRWAWCILHLLNPATFQEKKLTEYLFLFITLNYGAPGAPSERQSLITFWGFLGGL